MPNHVQNLIQFDGDISNLEGLKVSVIDSSTLALKLAILLLNDEKAWQEFLPSSDYEAVREPIDTGFKLLSDETVKTTLEKLVDSRTEISGYLSKPEISTIINRLSTDTPSVKIDWFDNSHICPAPLNVLINGFNASFTKNFPLESMAGTPSEYDWSILHLGTKWGAYSFKYYDGEMAFNTAWSCLNENVLETLVQKAEEITKAEPRRFYCAEQGVGFCGEGEFFSNDDESTYLSSLEFFDMDVVWLDETEEEEIEDWKKRGYEPCDKEGCYSPNGDMPTALVELFYYGWGG